VSCRAVLHAHVVLLPGGVIFAQNSKVTFKNCIFISNEALSAGRGSAIFSLNSDITIEGSVFINHNSKGDGGVIYAAQKSNVAIRNSYFESKSRLFLFTSVVIDSHPSKSSVLFCADLVENALFRH
jgi:predicted outer membrane repeat protein